MARYKLTPETDWFLTSGIGDVLAGESFMTPQERAAVKRIHWAMRCRPVLQPLFESNPVYKHVEHIDLFCEADTVGPGDYSGEKLPHHIICPEGALTWSWIDSPTQDGMYRRLQDKPYMGSSFLQHKLADVSRYNLPSSYVTIQPSTIFNVATERSSRDISQAEWSAVIKILDARDTVAVVVNAPGAEPTPVHPRLIDIQGLTSLAESIEVLKGGKGYIGTDSWISVLACQLYEEKDLIIRCSSAWYIVCRNHGYCGNHKKVNFLIKDFTSMVKTYPCDL